MDGEQECVSLALTVIFVGRIPDSTAHEVESTNISQWSSR